MATRIPLGKRFQDRDRRKLTAAREPVDPPALGAGATQFDSEVADTRKPARTMAETNGNEGQEQRGHHLSREEVQDGERELAAVLQEMQSPAAPDHRLGPGEYPEARELMAA